MNVEREVTVICPTYNSARFVAASLATVADQSRRPAELIVCDDGSTDDTCAVVEKLLKDFPCASRLLRLPHAGPGAARNAGLLAARTPWVAFFDSDDFWFTEKLERVELEAQRQPTVEMFCHNEENWRLNGTIRLIDFGRGVDLTKPIVPQLYCRNFFTPSAVVCRRQPILDCGLFDETFLSGQDFELWMRLAPTVRIAFIPEVLGVYVERRESISVMAGGRRFRNTARIFWRHRRKATTLTLVLALQRLCLTFFVHEVLGASTRLRGGPTKTNLLQRVGLCSRPVPLTRRVAAKLEPLASWPQVLISSRPQSAPAPRVMLFHDVSIAELSTFAELLHGLAQRWQFVGAPEFVAIMKGEAAPREQALLLTFDDGFRSNRRVAEEVLAKLDIPALFFVPSRFPFLRDRAEQRAFIADRICERRVTAEAVPADLAPMDCDDIRWLIANGHAIGSHTATHARLSRIPSRENLRVELEESAAQLEALTGRAVNLLAFPFGSVHSISARALRHCCGPYDFVFSGMRGSNDRSTPRFALRRDSFQPTDPPWYVSALLNGAFDRFYLEGGRQLESMARWAEGGRRASARSPPR